MPDNETLKRLQIASQAQQRKMQLLAEALKQQAEKARPKQTTGSQARKATDA